MNRSPQDEDISVLLFVHTPRSGGTGVTHLLREQFPKVARLSDAGDFRSFLGLSQGERDTFDMLAGHMPYGVDQFITRPHLCAVWLRDPVDRLVSSYFRARMTPGNGLYDYARSASLLEYVESAPTFMRDNGQTRRRASYRFEEVLEGSPFWWQRVPIGSVSEAMFEQACENLNRSSVGLYESFGESVRRLCAAAGIRPGEIPHVNASQRAEVIDKKPLDAIKDRHRFDQRLYDFAQKRFAEQQ
jgi:hypothetical protein